MKKWIVIPLEAPQDTCVVHGDQFELIKSFDQMGGNKILTIESNDDFVITAGIEGIKREEENKIDQHEVIVGNIGCVYFGFGELAAKEKYNEYVSQSKNNYGRAAGESVTWMKKNEIYEEFVGKIDSNNQE
jgi:hypothetical protein